MTPNNDNSNDNYEQDAELAELRQEHEARLDAVASYLALRYGIGTDQDPADRPWRARLRAGVACWKTEMTADVPELLRTVGLCRDQRDRCIEVYSELAQTVRAAVTGVSEGKDPRHALLLIAAVLAVQTGTAPVGQGDANDEGAGADGGWASW